MYVLTGTRSTNRSATTKAHRSLWRASLLTRTFRSPSFEALRRMGHDVVTIADAGKAGQALTDEAVLQFASADRRVVVTLNRRHFVRLHQEEPNQTGIIVCSLDLDFDGQAGRIDQALATQESMAGRLIPVQRAPTVRIPESARARCANGTGCRAPRVRGPVSACRFRHERLHFCPS